MSGQCTDDEWELRTVIGILQTALNIIILGVRVSLDRIEVLIGNEEEKRPWKITREENILDYWLLPNPSYSRVAFSMHVICSIPI